MRIAVSQMVGRLRDLAGNMEQACRLSQTAGTRKARIVLFPEGCLTGNAVREVAKQDVIPAAPAHFAPLQQVADQHDLAISIGFATGFGEKVNMVQAIVRPRQAMLFQHKAAKSDTEAEFLAPWPDPKRQVFVVDGARIATLICSEVSSDMVMARLKAVKADLLLHPSAGRLEEGEILATTRPGSRKLVEVAKVFRASPEAAARETMQSGLARVACNPIGFDGEFHWPGNSYAIDAEGNVRLWMKGRIRPTDMSASVEIVELPIRRCGRDSRAGNKVVQSDAIAIAKG